MIYADYSYYTDEYLGYIIKEQDFPRLGLRASQYLDYITQGRAQKNPQLEEVKMCCCALAEQYSLIDAAQALASESFTSGVNSAGAELQSQTVGGFSKTYRSAGETSQAAQNAAMTGQSALYTISQQYLAHTGLLYRGGGCQHGHVPSHGDSL